MINRINTYHYLYPINYNILYPKTVNAPSVLYLAAIDTGSLKNTYKDYITIAYGNFRNF
jgi:hypothetical protein